MRHASTTLALTVLFALAAAGDASAQRGGRAGGARPGGAGGAGYGGGRGGGPGVVSRGPSPGARPGYSPAARPGGANRPGAGNPPGGANRPGAGNPPGGVNRPGAGDLPGGANRPGAGNLPGGANRPGAGNPPGGVNRPGGANRPGAGNLPGIMDRPGLAAGNRTNVGNRTSIVNRPTNINTNVQQNARNTVVNRPTNIQQNVRNTQNVQNTVVNRPQINSNNRNVNVTNVTQNVVNNNRSTNVVNRQGNWGRPGFGNGAFPGVRPGVPGGRPNYLGPYAGFNRGWYNGYWSGHYSNRPSWNWGSFAVGAGVGGLLGWGYGSSVYRWGYTPFVNPYVVAAPIAVAVAQPVVVAGQPAATAYQAQAFDYSRPLDVDAPPPDSAVADPAVSDFDSARASFKAGDYAGALRLTDQALSRLPNDPALHEFRGLVLFALGQYEAAASAIYSVLSVTPGWDWTTLAGLYPGIDTYTAQLRALEGYRQEHPDSAPAHFLLAYHYLTAGHDDAAARELRETVRLKPSDTLSLAMLRQLAPDAAPTSAATAAATPTATPTVAASDAGLPALVGSWKAEPSPGTTIGLAIRDDGRFTWAVDQGGQSQKFDGTASSGNGILTLARDDDAGALVGKVARQGDDGFVFRLLGGPADDPGLNFRK